ncbi:hypothetical protein QYF36_015719 [Acer negundo]|nr:hypothetical protein QYF36_015719 [Acer negundo]
MEMMETKKGTKLGGRPVWFGDDGTRKGTRSDLSNLKNLKYLSMDYTNLNISILQNIGLLTSLESLSLWNCSLEGILPDQGGLCELKHLQHLHLFGNSLRGSLPWCFGNLTSLQVLDLYSNQFSGNISSSPLRALTSIQQLDLGDNQFQIPISLEPFFNHSKLKSFYGDNNQIYADTESHFSITPKFQLNTLWLSGCRDCVTFPKFLYHQHDLFYVYLSHNNLTGEFPNWLLDNNTNLHQLVLVNNSLTGPLHLPTHSHQNLGSLDISKNSFHGNIPIQVGAYLPMLWFLNISKNDFDGRIPSSFGDMNSLWSLDLSYNNLSGEIPEHLAKSCINLRYLVLSNNSLEGQIFSTANCNLTNLWRLQLDGNQFIGKIPECLFNSSSYLTVLHLGDNHLSDMTALHGNFSTAIEPMRNEETVGFELKNAASSNQSSVAPMKKEETVEFTTKKTSYSYQGKILTYMSGVDLSCNKLTGEIPHQIGNLTRIHTLNLSYNHLTGSIPRTFSNLEQIESLDLSHNNLNGKIPPQIIELYNLAVFSVAYNNLSGKTPQRINQFGTFEESSYQGNPLLCGLPLPKCCDANCSPALAPKASTDIEEDSNFMDMDIFYISFIASYIVVVLAIAIILYVNPYWRRTWFYLVETWMTSCYYFIIDHLLKGFRY